MTRKQLERICLFMLLFESDTPIEDLNKQFGVDLSENSSHEQALTAIIKVMGVLLSGEQIKDQNND